MSDPGSVWRDGALRAPDEADFDASDRAVRYGDGVFTTIGVRDGVLLDAAAHLRRLAEGAGEIGLRVPAALRDPAAVARIAADLACPPAGWVRIQVSARGAGRGYDRTDDASTCVVEVGSRPPPRRPRARLAGAECVPAALPHLKSCSALAHVVAAREATRVGVDEVIRTADGAVTEAISANLFWWSEDALWTPAGTLPLYAGVTRERTLAAAGTLGLETRVGTFSAAALLRCTAAFLTGAVRGVEPLVELEGRDLGWPAPLEALRRRTEEDRRTEGVSLPRGGAA